MSQKIDLRQPNKPGSDKKKDGKAYKINPVIKLLAPLHPAITDFEHRINRLREVGRKRGKRYSVIGITASIVIALAVIYAGYNLSVEIIELTKKANKETSAMLVGQENPRSNPSLPLDWRRCAETAECVLTQENCCACEIGGIQTAANKQYGEKWDGVLSKKCSAVNCVGAINCREGEAVCENNICEFKEAVKGGADAEVIEEPPVPPPVVDSDSDGLSDGDEAVYGTDPNNPDTDGDGYTDGEEIAAGYNPAGEGSLR